MTTQIENVLNENNINFEFVGICECSNEFIIELSDNSEENKAIVAVILNNLNIEVVENFHGFEVIKKVVKVPAKDVKKLIRKNLKVKGSHLGTVKHALETTYPNVDWSEYKEFAKKEQQKIFNKVEITIRASVRYQ